MNPHFSLAFAIKQLTSGSRGVREGCIYSVSEKENYIIC